MPSKDVAVWWCYIRTFKHTDMRKKDNSKGETYASCASYTLRTLHKEECDVGPKCYVPSTAAATILAIYAFDHAHIWPRPFVLYGSLWDFPSVNRTCLSKSLIPLRTSDAHSAAKRWSDSSSKTTSALEDNYLEDKQHLSIDLYDHNSSRHGKV